MSALLVLWVLGKALGLLRPRCCLVVSEALSLLGPAGWWTTGAWWSQRLETWTTLPRSFEVRLGLCWGSSVTAVTPWGHHSPEHLCQGWGLRSQLAQDRGEPFPEEPGGILAAVVCHHGLAKATLLSSPLGAFIHLLEPPPCWGGPWDPITQPYGAGSCPLQRWVRTQTHL